MQNTVQECITNKLQEAFATEYLEVINESHQHNVPKGSESHFKVVIVSAQFEGLRPIQRQQQVYKVLKDEMAGEVHALTMQTLTPEQWQADSRVTPSPECMGGSGA